MADYNRSRGGKDGGKRFGGGNRDNFGGGGRGGFGGGGARNSGRPSFDRRDGGRPQMHDAVCSECGVQCEVPFRPSGDKPVYCRECFGKVGNVRGAPMNNDSYGDNRRDSYDNDRQGGHKEPRREPARDSSPVLLEKFEALSARVETLNSKLDRILSLVTPVIAVTKEQQAQVVEKAKAKAEKKQEKTAKVPEIAKTAKPKKAGKKV